MSDFCGMEDGSVLETHEESVCRGQHCCVHNPSDHPLKDAPMVWVSAVRIMVRICPCHVLHPDPDHVNHIWRHSPVMALVHRVHDCCSKGCCDGPQ